MSRADNGEDGRGLIAAWLDDDEALRIPDTPWGRALYEALRDLLAEAATDAVLNALGLIEVEVETRWEGPPYLATEVPYVVPVDWRHGADDIKPSTVRLFMLAPHLGRDGVVS